MSENRTFINGSTLLDPDVSKVGVVAQLIAVKKRAGVVITADSIRQELQATDRLFNRHDCTDENVNHIMQLLAGVPIGRPVKRD